MDDFNKILNAPQSSYLNQLLKSDELLGWAICNCIFVGGKTVRLSAISYGST